MRSWCGLNDDEALLDASCRAARATRRGDARVVAAPLPTLKPSGHAPDWSGRSAVRFRTIDISGHRSGQAASGAGLEAAP